MKTKTNPTATALEEIQPQIGSESSIPYPCHLRHPWWIFWKGLNTAHLRAVGILLAALGNADAQTISTVQFASAIYSVNENGASITLRVQRIGEPDGHAWMEYATYNGSATNGEDYAGQSGVLEFFGKTNLTIVIPILNDAVAESDETFSVTLFNPDPLDTELGAFTVTIVAIRDNDRGVQFSAGTYTVDESAGMAVITVLAPDSDTGLSVNYSTESCSTTDGVDYVSQSGELTFAAGETEKTIVIPILDDMLAEGDETVNLTLSNPVGVLLGPQSNAVSVIRDDERARLLDADVEPQRIGIWSTSGLPIVDLEVAGDQAYLLTTGSLQVVDISNPANPHPVGFRATGQEASGAAVACGHLIVAERGGLEVFDITDPPNPRRVGQFPGTGILPYYTAVAVEGRRAFATVRRPSCEVCEDALEIIDLSDSTNPRLLGTCYLSANPSDVAVSGGYAYVASGNGFEPGGGLIVIDVSDPSHPWVVHDASRTAQWYPIVC